MRSLIPKLVALADVTAVAAYIAGIAPLSVQVASLALKLLFLPIMFRPGSILIRQVPSFLILTLACVLSIAIADDTRYTDVIATLGFLAHLGLTLMLVREELPAYLRTATYAISASAFLYAVFAALGWIPLVNDRLFYFNDLHPNLGSEIAAAAALTGAISVRYRYYLPISLVLLSNTVLMQGRAAMITIVAALALRTAHEIFTATDSSKVQLRVILATPLVLIALVFAIPYLSEALLLDSQYRGLGTGFVGRTDQWEIAWNAFIDHPIFGAGLGWFERTHELGAHNFFLYGLAEMGGISIILFVMLARMAVVAYQTYGWKIASLSPVLAMFMMNDRFLNLNPYPFLIWVMFFSLSVRPVSDSARPSSSALPVRLIQAQNRY